MGVCEREEKKGMKEKGAKKGRGREEDWNRTDARVHSIPLPSQKTLLTISLFFLFV